ncbi:hypothetical protein AABB24_029222 [Solanum stoloniferum]|uniref:Uncharacterized protein n=1 Tax=Solanum stoloniferum TaxID=62892 RepID=A0ABD2SCA1_9SOLN
MISITNLLMSVIGPEETLFRLLFLLFFLRLRFFLPERGFSKLAHAPPISFNPVLEIFPTSSPSSISFILTSSSSSKLSSSSEKFKTLSSSSIELEKKLHEIKEILFLYNTKRITAKLWVINISIT